MRLSEEEKRELLEDAQSGERREAFRKAKEMNYKGSRSLDDYIQFLDGIQKVFGPFPAKNKITITQFNKL